MIKSKDISHFFVLKMYIEQIQHTLTERKKKQNLFQRLFNYHIKNIYIKRIIWTSRSFFVQYNNTPSIPH